MLKRLTNKKGQGATEYIVILGIIVTAAVLFGTSLGPALKSQVQSIISQISSAG